MIRICLSIYNRSAHLIKLIKLINKLLEINNAMTVHITDFQSNDSNIIDILNNVNCKYELDILKEDFNLGKGWNNSSNMESILDDDILLFLTNDVHINNCELFIKECFQYTQYHKSVYCPMHLCQDSKGNYKFLGGATLFSVYKSDFIKMGYFAESCYWGMAGVDKGNYGEDGDFFNKAKNNNLILNNFRSDNVIALWHPRDFNDPWYKNSSRAIEMKNIGNWK